MENRFVQVPPSQVQRGLDRAIAMLHNEPDHFEAAFDLHFDDTYDDLDELKVAVIETTRHKQFALTRHKNAPEAGVIINVDERVTDLDAEFQEAAVALGIKAQDLKWVHPEIKQQLFVEEINFIAKQKTRTVAIKGERARVDVIQRHKAEMRHSSGNVNNPDAATWTSTSLLTRRGFKQAISLLEKKDALQKQIEDIDARVASLFGGKAASAAVATPKRRGGRLPGSTNKKTTAPRARRGPGVKRGDLKIKVLAALKDAGEAGLSIKEMSDKLKTKGSNLYAWFGSTGKKVTEIRKVGPAKYKVTLASKVEKRVKDVSGIRKEA